MRKERGSSSEAPPDEANGEVTVYRIDTANKVSEVFEIEREHYGQFYGGDCYIIKYFNQKPLFARLYYWQDFK